MKTIEQQVDELTATVEAQGEVIANLKDALFDLAGRYDAHAGESSVTFITTCLNLK